MLRATLSAGQSGVVMSEPVTNAEVEDVLSSIRRLVGETKRPQQVQIEGEQHPDETEMLILTPQLRVASGHDVLKLMPEDAVTPVGEWYEFEEPPLPEHIRPTPDTHIIPQDPAEAPLELAEQDLQQTSVEVKRTSKAEFMELSAKIAALETAIAKTVDQWEPDGTDSDDYSGTQPPAMTWQDNVELDGLGKPVAQTVPFPQVVREQHASVEDAETVLEAALDEQVIDEETLRAMVADIVRSELQGELGERITRNVRNLVRREIHRALVSQSLD